MTIKEIAEKVLQTKNCEMHIEEIAKEAIAMKLSQENDIEKLTKKIASVLANDVLKFKEKSLFRKVKNQKGGNKKGIYKLKRQSKSPTERIIEKIKETNDFVKPETNSNYIGKGGECAVLSELLFNGYNANIMVVDEGIDIVASKNDKFFYIQVKTTHIKKKQSITTPSIKFSRFSQYDKQNTFYIIVLRYYLEKNPRNEYLIFRSSDIEKFIETGKIKRDTERINLSIKLEDRKIYLFNGKSIEDINYHFNNFEIIK